MNRIRFYSAALAALTCLATLASGCAREKTPPDMPKLYPTSITVTQDGAPCVDACVQLLKRDDLNYKWLAGGTTDETGTCVVKTMGKFNGAPEGDFNVIVYKTIRNESETRKNVAQPTDPAEAREWIKKVAEEEKEFDYVDTKYKKVDTSDLTITVSRGKNAVAFEVGPEVKVENVSTLQKL